MAPVGVHVIAKLTDVRHTAALESQVSLQAVMNDICEAAKLTKVGEVGKQFTPSGATHVLLLSESHFSAHSWFETRSLYVDLFCCAKDFDVTGFVRLLQQHFDGTVEYEVIER
jgi:S-adenosylmethionine decarboxylase